jgi:hypothetical protein
VTGILRDVIFLEIEVIPGAGRLFGGGAAVPDTGVLLVI